MKKPLNELIRDTRCLPFRIITADTTYVPEKTGWYKVICVGAGSGCYARTVSPYHNASGASGGVAIKVIRLVAETNYSVLVGTDASFNNIMTATGGTNPKQAQSSFTPSVGGTATGGDYNFNGSSGESGSDSTSAKIYQGASVNVSLTELTPIPTALGGVTNGDGVLRYGGGGSLQRIDANNVVKGDGQPAAVIIIPLEMEE